MYIHLNLQNSFMIPFPDIMVRVASLPGKSGVSNNGETSFGHLDKPDLWQVSKEYTNEALKTVAVSLLMMVKNGK